MESFVSHCVFLLGGNLLQAIGVWILFFENEENKLTRNYSRWTLLITAAIISLDELAIALLIGLIGIPLALTILLIVIHSFWFVFIGLTFGSEIKPSQANRYKKLAGSIFDLLGLWIVTEMILIIAYQKS